VIEYVIFFRELALQRGAWQKQNLAQR